MTNRIVMLLLRRKLKLKKYQFFRFSEQKTNAVYYISDTNVMKLYRGKATLSNVSINHLLSERCHIFIATSQQIRKAQKKKESEQ